MVGNQPRETSVTGLFKEPTAGETEPLLKLMVGRRVLVVGDILLDAYLMGSISRISPEAPVPVLAIEREEHTLGGAGNVAKVLVAQGAQVKLAGVVGDDAEGALVLRETRGLGIDAEPVLTDASRPTSVKRRVVAQRQQMIRLDRESTAPLDKKTEDAFIQGLKEALEWSEAVILSDYLKGVLTERVCRFVIENAGSRPTVVDPKGTRWDRYKGVTVFKPNVKDVIAFLNETIKDDATAEASGRHILQVLGCEHVLITRGERGITLASQKGGQILHLRSRPRQVSDVTGAGDVVAATVTLALASGAEPATAAWVANVAAGVKVEKFGTAAVSGQEILEALGHNPGRGIETKVMDLASAADLAGKFRAQGKKVVFTNGCFDILHYGHVSYLEKARKLGDALIVGINSDESVRTLKGPGRPIQHEHDRARILASQASIDAVVVFGQATPIDLINAIKPDVLCKGQDYTTKESVVGWKEVESWGGRVELIQFEEGRSTTGILKRV
jgi:D-beta-D-heptose 7-phosphate kinase / D-beta-D-heptose 1-phosphate adenosyltransferase